MLNELQISESEQLAHLDFPRLASEALRDGTKSRVNTYDGVQFEFGSLSGMSDPIEDSMT
jgi:hypothetical protein